MIFVFLDSGKYTTNKQGNCLRLFALQAVSADAMRKVFDNPNDFEDKKTRLKQYCESNLTNSRNNELFSRNLVFCYFDSFFIYKHRHNLSFLRLSNANLA